MKENNGRHDNFIKTGNVLFNFLCILTDTILKQTGYKLYSLEVESFRHFAVFITGKTVLC